jgi:pimeloyl-ACP methyl ester carboxylesterase
MSSAIASASDQAELTPGQRLFRLADASSVWVEVGVHERDLSAVAVGQVAGHGTHDELVPTRLSESFFAALPFGHKELWVVPNGNHRLNQEIGDILARIVEEHRHPGRRVEVFIQGVAEALADSVHQLFCR